MPPRVLALWGQNPAGAIIEDETEARLATSRSLCVATVLQRETKSRNKQREVQWLAHLPFTSVIRVRFLLGAVIRLTFYLGSMLEACFQFDSTKHRRFSPGTPVSSTTNTGATRDDLYWTSMEKFRYN